MKCSFLDTVVTISLPTLRTPVLGDKEIRARLPAVLPGRTLTVTHPLETERAETAAL
jgi:hypothetical protein